MTMTAQNQGSITGKVIDNKTKEALPYVSIVVKENGTVIGGGITEDNGTFTVKNLPLKNLAVEIQFMGYKTQNLTAALSDAVKTVNMGTLSIKEEATTLDEVNIVKEVSTIEQKLDRKVITVGRDLTTAGGTASEIMNNIPSVNVDQDGKISLRGNANVRVLVDGRPTNMDPAQLLKQIPSTSIKKIELITNPSAKYNPEGMSGIINIVLHKNANDGFNGNFNAGITFGETPKVNNSLDMNYRTGKVNFFANVGSNSGKYFNNGFVQRNDEIGSRQLIDVVNDNESVLGKFGMDYYLNDNNTISAYTNQNYSTGDATIGTDIFYAPDPTKDVSQHSALDGDNRNNTYNLAFKHKFEKEGHTLDFEGNYNDTKNTQDVDYNTTFASKPSESYHDGLVDKRKNTTLNLDYINPLNDKSTLELGAETRIIRSDNTYNSNNAAITKPEDRNIAYNYDQDIYSAYATFGQKFEKFSYQLGARFESYKVNANSNGVNVFKDDYLTVYPSAYLTYTLNEKNMFQISYSRRVDRPSIEQATPIREFSTTLITSRGNSELKPQFTNSVELNYTKTFGQGSSITAGVFYRLINDEISRVLYPNDETPNTEDQVMSFRNFDHNNSYGFELSANYKILKWWDIQPAIDFSSLSQKGVVNIVQPDNTSLASIKSITANAFNARINSNFRVNDRLTFNMFGFYRGPVNGVQSNSKEMYKIDTGARYTLLDSKMSLSVRFSDMFKTMRYAFDSTNPYPQTGEFKWESRTVYVGINYMFGGGKNRAMARKQREDNTKQAGGGMF